MGRVEVRQKHLGRRLGAAPLPQFLEAGQEPVDAQRRAHPRQRLLGVQAGEVVVAAARADTAEARQVVEEALEHDPGVVVEPAGDARIDHHAAGRHARGRGTGDDSPQRCHARRARPLLAHELRKPPEHLLGGPGERGHFQERGRGRPTHALCRELGRHRLGARLAELVEAPQDARGLAGQVEPPEHAAEHAAVVDPDREPLHTDRRQEVVDHEHHLQIGHGARGADRVEVALHELAIPAPLGVLAPPDHGHVIPLERQAEFVDVLGGEPGEGHGQVEPHPHLAATVVGEPVELLVGLLAPLAGEDLEVFERRRVDRREAVGAVDAAGDVEHPLPGEGLGREMVAEAFERAGLDHHRICSSGGLGLRIDRPRLFFLRPSPIESPPGPRTASMYSTTCSGVSKYWS